MSYINDDGLYVLTNGDQGVVQDTGRTAVSARQTLVIDIPDFTEIGSTFGATDIDPNDAYIPAGSVIMSATLKITTAADSSGDGATLTIGTYDPDGGPIDADGIDATIAQTAIDASGDTVRCDGVQTTTRGYVSENAYIGMVYGTEAYTAGAGKLLVEFIQVD